MNLAKFKHKVFPLLLESLCKSPFDFYNFHIMSLKPNVNWKLYSDTYLNGEYSLYTQTNVLAVNGIYFGNLFLNIKFLVSIKM